MTCEFTARLFYLRNKAARNIPTNDSAVRTSHSRMRLSSPVFAAFAVFDPLPDFAVLPDLAEFAGFAVIADLPELPDPVGDVGLAGVSVTVGVTGFSETTGAAVVVGPETSSHCAVNV